VRDVAVRLPGNVEVIKQVIVVRKDLHMRRGKEIAQGSHASMAFITRQLLTVGTMEMHLTDAAWTWLNGQFTKVCLQVNSEQELLDLHMKAIAAGLESHIITDAGKTEFNNVPTKTCLAIGPDEAEKIDAVTGDLRLY
jgi:PTH2 family peptidyl-tRNA hydrolase